MRNPIKLTAFITFLSLLGCSSNEIKQATPAEEIEYLDFSAPQDKALTDEYWIVEKMKHPDFPISAARDGLSGCVELIVGIGSDGKVVHFKVNRSFPEGVFDLNAAAAMKRWRWSAHESNVERKPVLTSIQLDFMVNGASNQLEAEAQCKFTHF